MNKIHHLWKIISPLFQEARLIYMGPQPKPTEGPQPAPSQRVETTKRVRDDKEAAEGAESRATNARENAEKNRTELGIELGRQEGAIDDDMKEILKGLDGVDKREEDKILANIKNDERVQEVINKGDVEDLRKHQIHMREMEKFIDPAVSSEEWAIPATGKTNKNGDVFIYRRAVMDGRPVLLAYAKGMDLQALNLETGEWDRYIDAGSVGLTDKGLKADYEKVAGGINKDTEKKKRYDRNRDLEDNILKKKDLKPENLDFDAGYWEGNEAVREKFRLLKSTGDLDAARDSARRTVKKGEGAAPPPRPGGPKPLRAEAEMTEAKDKGVKEKKEKINENNEEIARLRKSRGVLQEQMSALDGTPHAEAFKKNIEDAIAKIDARIKELEDENVKLRGEVDKLKEGTIAAPDEDKEAKEKSPEDVEKMLNDALERLRKTVNALDLTSAQLDKVPIAKVWASANSTFEAVKGPDGKKTDQYVFKTDAVDAVVTIGKGINYHEDADRNLVRGEVGGRKELVEIDRENNQAVLDMHEMFIATDPDNAVGVLEDWEKKFQKWDPDELDEDKKRKIDENYDKEVEETEVDAKEEKWEKVEGGLQDDVKSLYQALPGNLKQSAIGAFLNKVEVKNDGKGNHVLSMKPENEYLFKHICLSWVETAALPPVKVRTEGEGEEKKPVEYGMVASEGQFKEYLDFLRLRLTGEGKGNPDETIGGGREKGKEEFPLAADAPVGQRRRDKEGNIWAKDEDDMWHSTAEGYEDTSWSNTLMDEQTAEILPKALQPAAEAPTGQRRIDKDGDVWEKTGENTWESDAHEGLAWSDILMDEQTTEVLREFPPAAEAPAGQVRVDMEGRKWEKGEGYMWHSQEREGWSWGNDLMARNTAKILEAGEEV